MTPTSERALLAPIVSLLSRLTLKELDADLLAALRQPELLAALEQLEPGCRAHIERPWSTDDFDACSASYAALFLVPGGVPPFAAAWAEGDPGTLRAELQGRVEEVLGALQVKVQSFGLGNVPADHIGVLLAAWSLALEVEPTLPTDAGLAARTHALLAGWGRQLGKGMVAKSEDPLYRAAGHLLRDLLARPA